MDRPAQPFRRAGAAASSRTLARCGPRADAGSQRKRAALRLTLAALALTAAAVAWAHGNVVRGAVTVTPDPPRPGRPWVVTVELQSSSGAPVEGARLVGELKSQAASGAPSPAPATALAFKEYQEPYGTYRAQLVAPPAGTYRLALLDETYPKERTRAQVTLSVGGSKPNGALDFAFPPTGGSRSLSTWLLWLVGLPVVAGIVVTVLVLRSRPGREGRADEDA